jgi:hypothetical protein
VPSPDDRFIELEKSILDDEPAPPAQPKRRNRAGRLPHLPTHFIRVPVPWLTRSGLFEPGQRLFLLLLYKSHWGQKGVRLTNALAAEVGISSRTKARALQRLLQAGLVRVEQHGRQAPTVWPKVLLG